MPWTNVTKPSSTTYTNINGTGREIYDQSDVLYDDPDVFFDGVNPNMWTEVAKPVNTASVISVGYANGLLMPLTKSSLVSVGQETWTKVTKPII